MKPRFSLFAFSAAALLGGCITPAKSPSEAAHLKLETTDSGKFAVENAWIDKHQLDQGLYITGYVVSHPGVLYASDTHLDIIQKDASGTVIKMETARFSLRENPRRPRSPQRSGYYHFHIDPLPSGVASIEVRAHDEAHANRS